MISHKYRCIYIHIPKTGGTSIEAHLKKNCQALGWEKEPDLPYEMRREGLARTINLYPDYYLFTFVRNPFDRIISAWSHSNHADANHIYYQRPKPQMTLLEYLQCIKGDQASLSLFDKYHTLPQSIFLIRNEQKKLFTVPLRRKRRCDFVGRYESLSGDMSQVLQNIHADDQSQVPLPHLRKGKRNHYASYFDKYTRALTIELYQIDFVLFNYPTKFEIAKAVNASQ